ncbi:hypothetical protein PS3A_13460 [Pseudomonas sp. 3A(2025)]
MALTSQISLYDSQWPMLFQVTRQQVTKAFGSELMAIHHAGSTAVEGLAAKPEIDVLVVVEQHCDEARRNGFLQGLGYVRGSDLSPGHHFYRRDVNGVRTHKIHVCINGHIQIEWMLRFRDLLRRDASIRQQYQDLKLELEASNTGGIGEYLARKAPFIDTVMQAWPHAAKARQE